MADISAIPQNQLLGRLAGFLRFLEKDRPEFLPSQLGAMQAASKLMLPQASTVENLSYGNLPFTMPPSGTGAMIPQVKTGRKAEVADLVGMITGVPGAKTVADVGTKLSNEAADALVRMITRNPQATAPGVLQETAMPFMNAIAPRQPGLLSPQKSELGFYSALEQATMPLQNKGTGAQFLAQIEKTPGVKPEELKWTGLDEFLRSRQNVTKAEVQDYLNANRVNIQEVRLGGDLTDPTGTYPYRSAEEWSDAVDMAGRARNWDEVDRLHQAWEAAEGFGPAGSTKFSKYTLPGGENYREILLTLPESMEAKMFRDLELRVNAGERLKPEELQKYYDLVDAQAFKNQFFGSHYDQANILAHMRVNDRVVDGKKTLFIEEIQSDWHQAGRKNGYATKQNLESWYNQNKLENDPPFAALNDEQLRVIEANRMAGMGGSNLVPDAPFKTSWHELTLKRAIQEASEKGYDQIAFTTGKTQAERYDLSKQVNKIDVEAVEEVPNLYFVDVDVAGRGKMNLEVENGVVRQGEFEGKPLEDVVGKEIAEKVFAVQQGQTTRLQGDDLRIGGEGMKGFYDQILPKSLEKLGKKFDAKVGKTEMDGVEVWQMDITPKMRESVLTKGQPLFAATPVLPAGLLGRDEEE